MDIFDPNELAATVIDQAHTIRIQARRLTELERVAQDLSRRLEAQGVAADIVASARAADDASVDASAPATDDDAPDPQD